MAAIGCITRLDGLKRLTGTGTRDDRRKLLGSCFTTTSGLEGLTVAGALADALAGALAGTLAGALADALTGACTRDDLRKTCGCGSATELSKAFNKVSRLVLSNTILETFNPSCRMSLSILFCLLTLTITLASLETVLRGTINNDDLL